MKHSFFKRSAVCFAVIFTLMLGSFVPASALNQGQVQSQLQAGVNYVLATVTEPKVSSVGGEWAVLGLARSGCEIPQNYWDGYYRRVEQTVKDCGGILHPRKYTEYSRLVLALTAIGADPTNVAGHNLISPLGDYEKVVWQGVNGPIYALLALDCGDYEMPGVRQKYVDYILQQQCPEGGWSLTHVSDPDLTGMALQALAKYQNQSEVHAAIQKALSYLAEVQNSNGSFDTLESTAQVLVAICELGLELNDEPLSKSGNTLLDGLLTFRRSDGSFVHALGQSGNDQMASEQGLYALAAAVRATEGKSSLYRMDDVAIRMSNDSSGGLSGSHTDVSIPKLVAPGMTFGDIVGHANQIAIEALAQRGIAAGKGNGRFDPEATLTRAEFTTFIVRTLGLTPKAEGTFRDVAANAWYAGFVGTAHRYGIVSGVGNGNFAPSGTITRQQAAVMMTKAAALCGLTSELTQAKILDTLSLFGDYPTVNDWAKESVAFCYDSGIWDDSEWDIQPHKHITRSEMAQLLYNLVDVCHMLEG